ncbi:MAG TPA: hypothetical protein VEI51_00775 [Methanomicrobiales archaeon]|nr:hypothetical protein [Methanomicrobiales archaeon]
MEPGTGPEPGAEGTGASQPPIVPDWKKWVVPGLVLAAAVVIGAALFFTVLATPPPVSTSPPAPVTIAGTTVPPTTIARPHHRTPVTSVPATPGAIPSVTGEPTQAPAQETAVPTTPACIPAGAPGFTVTISPDQATAHRGDTVVYHMTIDAQNCFADPIHMTVTAGFLFFSQTQDLGVQDPPFPKTLDYAFKVPDTLPPGVTLNGKVTSTSGTITREDQLSLTVQ